MEIIRTAEKILSTYKQLTQDTVDINVRNARVEIHSMYDLGWYIRQGVHFGLFMGAIMSSVSPSVGLKIGRRTGWWKERYCCMNRESLLNILKIC